MVEDLPRRCDSPRDGEDWPEFLESGRKRAVAGETLCLFKKATAADGLGEVALPSRLDEEGLDGVGVSFPVILLDVLARSGVQVERDVLDPTPCMWTWESPPFCRWAMGNMGSGCFCLRRGRRKKVVVVWTVCVVVVVLPYTRWSPELPSDLEDSDKRLLNGSARPLPSDSSPYAGGIWLMLWCRGSSKVTAWRLPDMISKFIVFLRSLLEMG